MIDLQQHEGWHLPAEDITMPGDMRQGGYQIKHQDGFLQHISRTTGYQGVAVDIGAHIGLWSRRLMQCYRWVYAFEPIPELAECYRKNAQQSNYELRQVALGDRRETLIMRYEPHRSQNTHIHSEGNITVPVQRLDDQRIDHVGLIKIDVEGWEIPVLLGGEAMILRDLPWIIVEQKQGAQARVGRHKQEITRLLESWGYRRVSKIANDVLYQYNG